MTSRLRPKVGILSVLLLFTVIGEASAQWSASTRYLRGQSLQPVYEGWEQNPDGTYSMWFGYLNRNWEQRLVIPVGPENSMEPGPADRGQPTVFSTGDRRRHHFAFKVVLPRDWPKDRDLVWTVTANGVPQKAIGSLWPVWMVDSNVVSANRGAMRDTDPSTINNPPVVTEPAKDATVPVGMPLTLTVGVTDDDMPKRRRPGELVAGGGVVVPVNPGSQSAGGRSGRGGGRGSPDAGPPLRDSLRVTWVQWRGPGTVKFDPEVARVLGPDGTQTGTSGRATTTATFDQPGTYVLRAYAEDMSLFTIAPDVTVTVTAPSSSSQP
jgi:hypothetical protein